MDEVVEERRGRGRDRLPRAPNTMARHRASNHSSFGKVLPEPVVVTEQNLDIIPLYIPGHEFSICVRYLREIRNSPGVFNLTTKTEIL
jgi:hypothetical protein